MIKVKQILTARRLSLGLIILLAGLMYVSTLVPQEIESTPGKIGAWRLEHPILLWLVDTVNLHSIYSQPWFAVVILFAALALGISSFDQLTVARKKLRGAGRGSGEQVAEFVLEESLRAVASSYRYLFVRTASPEQLKFVRNPWGYFGSPLLHFGMTLVITASLFVALTGRQGALIMVEGEQRGQLQPWNVAEHGLLSAPLKLPGIIRLDKVRVRFGSNNQPTEVSSDISFADESGRVISLVASINRISRYLDLRIYHASQYGDAFTVAFTDKNGNIHAEKILVQHPLNLTSAGYSDAFGVTWSPYAFAAKYYADADHKSMLSTNPQLTVRILDGTKEIARTSLTPGSSGTLGEYRLRLLAVEKWAKLIIVDSKGMSVIFAGFAVIMLGGLIHYLTPPREIIGSRQQDGCFRVSWKATAFNDFFLEERDNLAEALSRELG